MAIVGSITENVILTLGLAIPKDTPIYLGASNIAHMKQSHPAAYARYGADIMHILAHPDYVGINPTDQSIEYVKEYVVEGEFVKVAVRVTGGGRYFARSLYVLNSRRTQNFIQKGTLKHT